MKSGPGSCERAAQIAARQLLDQGCTSLEARIGAHVASFGANCWQTDRKLQSLLLRSDGDRYHRESIGRARRNLARAGFLTMKRVFSGEIPKLNGKKANYVSPHGTTSKALRWDRLGVPDPMSRRERAIEQRKHESEQRRADRARFMSMPPSDPVLPRPRPDAELERVLETFVRTQSEAAERRSQRPTPTPREGHGRGPPET